MLRKGALTKRMCTNCILDTLDDPEITFDEKGVCSYCAAISKINKVHRIDNKEKALEKLVAEIKAGGQGKDYDCIIGVSGGVDSTYVAYLVKQLGLRPLAVHLDYGWNSELAVANIQTTLKGCNIDLYTHVVDWEEIKDLQLAFLKASVVDIELINDFAIFATLYNEAYKRGIKYILNGINRETEGDKMPSLWVHEKFDELNIRAIHKQFGTKKLKTYPRLSFSKKAYFHAVLKIQFVPILDYIDYNKEQVKKFISSELGWRDYGGKHFESIFTRFYQAYILPRKFHIDKRKFHLSALIWSGQISRSEAMEELNKPVYDEKVLEGDYEFVLKKLGLSKTEFEAIMDLPRREHLEFPSYVTKHYKYHASFFKAIGPLSRLVKKLGGKP